jgi:hypothetical protein
MLVDAALMSLAVLGYLECCAMITVGNDVSELGLRNIPPHSTVTLFAKFLGLSTSVPLAQAV